MRKDMLRMVSIWERAAGGERSGFEQQQFGVA